jgi:hypothetical protein
MGCLVGVDGWVCSQGCVFRGVVGLPAALSDPKGPESLFFAGPKKSNPKKWPDELVGYAG